MQQEGERIMEIRKITGIVPADKRAVETAFGSIEPQPVACCNWPEQYPYEPEVSFRMFHTGAYLMLRFDVREQWTMARVTEDNGEVWTDSCVEFFIAPDDSGYYYNFECTCIGRLLVGFRREREHATHACLLYTSRKGSGKTIPNRDPSPPCRAGGQRAGSCRKWLRRQHPEGNLWLSYS